ncbi:MAG: alanine dehydrogenase [Gammaproteobacteria bacterium]|nr:MAG: alanine dehydrogenase [Gammaproteobacteria bacterium]TND07279.1 MAG: alanine dehydrogenase [Gammaproteobacteria bacterium]
MRIGVPREIKVLEGRVGLIPAAVADLVVRGHTVLLETGAGILSGYRDDDYRAVGADILPDAAAVYGDAELIVKVKEPLESELALLRPEHLLFCYLHLAANPHLLIALRDIGLTAVAFETVEESGGRLPLLAPMSDIAGRLATQIGMNLLYHPNGGKGILLGGLPAAERGSVVILGAGVVGHSAALVAAALGAQVTVFDLRRERLEQVRALGNNVTGLHPFAATLEEAVVNADLLIGAVLVTGERAPHLVSADTVRKMGNGSVIVDVSVDQGGCIETTRPTDYSKPTFVWEGVVHCAVTNMPGAVPRSASQALSAALLPYVFKLTQDKWWEHPALYAGINLSHGEVVNPHIKTLLK